MGQPLLQLAMCECLPGDLVMSGSWKAHLHLLTCSSLGLGYTVQVTVTVPFSNQLSPCCPRLRLPFVLSHENPKPLASRKGHLGVSLSSPHLAAMWVNPFFAACLCILAFWLVGWILVQQHWTNTVQNYWEFQDGDGGTKLGALLSMGSITWPGCSFYNSVETTGGWDFSLPSEVLLASLILNWHKTG